MGTTGSALGLAAIGFMIWLWRDARLYEWAVKQVDRTGIELAKRHAEGDVTDAVWLILATGLIFLAVTAEAAAGFAAIIGQSMLAIPLLVASEILVVLTAASLVVLGAMKMHRRNAVLSVIRLEQRIRSTAE